jgi:hypothetical protein
VRRLKGEPNFDNSWSVELDAERSAAVVLRYLRPHIDADGHLLVGESNLSRNREFLLVRHSVTPGFDYAPLHRAISKMGYVLDLPTRSTYLVKTTDRTNAHILGDRLEEFCPYDSLMVTGLAHDFAIWTSTDGMYVASEGWLVRDRAARA